MTCGPNTWVFLHQLLDPAGEPHHRVANADRVRAILAASGKVKGVVQGHFHPGAENTADGIPYITLPALCEEGIAFGQVPLSVILEI